MLSVVSTGFIAFGLWVHHMFATGLPQLGHSFFTAASMMIAVPNGVQIFCWIATLWLGKLRFRVPLLYVLGFVAIFVMGGLTGMMLASVPLDLQVHDSYFVVAHFHYVLIGGAVFPLLGALTYWFPKATGRMLSERAGRWSFGLHLRRLQPGLLPDAPPGAARDAAPRLQLRRGDRLDALERAGDRRRDPDRDRAAAAAGQHDLGGPARRAGRRRSVGGRRARVGDQLAATAVRLPRPADRDQPRAALVGSRSGAAA